LDSENIGNAIKKARKEKKLTQKQLGDIIGKAESTIRKYENGSIEIPNSVLTEIGRVLGVFFFKFVFDQEDNFNDKQRDSTYFLDQKLAQIGFRVTGDEAEGYMWLEGPGGTYEITEDELTELDNSTTSYLKFKVNELVEKSNKIK
jgi:transcriptional regulator with XRE-family HTH domain